jgi:hypothetical protein
MLIAVHQFVTLIGSGTSKLAIRWPIMCQRLKASAFRDSGFCAG